MTHPARYCPSKAQKPIRGSLLNTSHPLARGLILSFVLNENVGVPFDGARRILTTPDADGSPIWQTGIGGMGANTTNIEYSWVVGTTADVLLLTTTPLTIFYLFERTGTFEDNDSRAIFYAKSAANWEHNNGFYIYHWSNGSSHEPFGMVADGTNYWYANEGSPNALFPTGKLHSCAAHFTSNADKGMWINGEPASIGAGGTPAVNSHSSRAARLLAQGDSGSGAGFYNNGIMYCLYMWNRKLVTREIQQLHREPYCML